MSDPYPSTRDADMISTFDERDQRALRKVYPGLPVPKISVEFPRFTIQTAINDMVADRLLAPSFEKVWDYIRARLVGGGFSRNWLIQLKTRMRPELWRLHVELKQKVGPAAQLQQWAYELERCA